MIQALKNVEPMLEVSGGHRRLVAAIFLQACRDAVGPRRTPVQRELREEARSFLTREWPELLTQLDRRGRFGWSTLKRAVPPTER